MFIPHGVGSNGKNILLDIVQEVMGDYAVTIPPEALMATRHDGDAEKPSSVAATLAGARAAISSESKENQRLDVALVKRHTGGGFMNARLMRENSFRFAISHKLVLMTNHRPTLDHMDEAIRGRLHMIPFDRVWNRPGHPDRDPTLPDGDKGLMDALRTESEGVLAWLVEGAELYHRDGLEPPAEVTKATRDYFATEDSFGRWIETMEPCDPKAGTRASDLFNNFNAHCISHARRPSIATQTAFSLELKKRGTASRVTANGTFYGLTYGGLVGSGGLF
jgi:putative DNA primase/helicase